MLIEVEMSHCDRAKRILTRLDDVDRLPPDDELLAYEDVLDDLTGLLNAPDDYDSRGE